MKVSLILATLGEQRDIPRFLGSLSRQGDVPCELVIVDQNADDRIAELLARAVPPVRVRHVRARPGLSAARNVGIEFADGDVIGFPDDDCWYADGFLAAVARILSDPGLDGLTCRCTDEQGRLAAGAEDRRSGPVTRRNIWGRGVSATMFLKRSAVRAVGRFDEGLGLGNPTPFQSGEETDYLLRCLSRGLRVDYHADLRVHHPLPPDCRLPHAPARSHAYGMGMGRVLRMHGFGLAEIAWHLGTPVVGAACAALTADPALARVRISRAVGRWRGWAASPAGGTQARVAAPARPFHGLLD